MSDLQPVTVTIHLLTMRGYLMQQELVESLQNLTCTECECLLHVEEVVKGFEIFLRCRRTLEPEVPWVVENDDQYPNHTTYRAAFKETVSAAEIVMAIRRLLGTPLLMIYR